MNKSVFSFLRTLTTWHCLLSPAARRCCCAPGNNRPISTVSAGTDMQTDRDCQRDRETDTVPLHRPCSAYTGWAKKTGLFFRLDNFVTVSPRKAYSMSKFSQFYREKVQNWHFNEFKYSLPNLPKTSQQLKLWYI